MDSVGVLKAASRPEGPPVGRGLSMPGQRSGWMRSLVACAAVLVVLASPWLGAVAADERLPNIDDQ